MTFVVDTNVIVVANGRDVGQVTPLCVLRCVERLGKIRKNERIALDRGYEILDEYFKKANRSGQPGAGDAFAKWVFDNQWNVTHCDLVEITPMSDGGYREFPADPQLVRFHLKDRKFVAVSVLHPERPHILYAADSDWDDFLGVLAENGIVVHSLCT
jgi:hypothetical protein